MTQSVIHKKNILRYGSPHVDKMSTYHSTITEEAWLVVILITNQTIVTLYCVKVAVTILITATLP